MTPWRSLVLVAVLGCGPTPLSLVIDVGDVPACPSTSCEDILLGCDPYVSIRIFDPDEPKSPYVSICQPMQLDHKGDLCSIANTQLPSNVNVPSQSLEVDVVIYQKLQLAIDMSTGEPLCPTDIEFEAVSGFPVEGIVPQADQAPNLPAIGGRAFYHPGDAQTVVTLGCAYLGLVTPPETCASTVFTTVRASAIDFDFPLAPSVSSATADDLDLAVGEPQPMDTETIFDSRPLPRVVDVDPPQWSDSFELAFMSTVCVKIIDEETGETTPTLTCQSTASGLPIDIAAVRLVKSSLDQILTAIGSSSFPDQGLVVGLVLDGNRQPKSGVTVVPTDGSAHVQYINATRSGVVTGMTSASGIFVSQDAPYPTTFSASDGTNAVFSPPGGLVVGKVTIVLIEFD